MRLEDDLRNLAPALDRAIDEAARGVGRPGAEPVEPSRRRGALVALAAAVLVVAAVGVGARLVSSDRHHNGITTHNPTTLSGPAATSTTSTTTQSTTTTEATTTTTAAAGVALPSVQWSSVTYPIEPHCAGLRPPVTVIQTAYAVPATGVSLAIVLVRCNSGAGTPPSALFVYDRATSPTAPHLAATLVSEADGWQAGNFSRPNPVRVQGASITLTALGFSSTNVANCCPDVHATLTWQWNGDHYVVVGNVPPHVRNPALGSAAPLTGRPCGNP